MLIQHRVVFHFLCPFPKRNIYNFSPSGKAMFAERKVGFQQESGFRFPEIDKRREIIMKNNNQINIPQAREAMDKFKMQAAQEVGVNLTNGYNGHLTSREAGSVGGQMVKNKCPVRTMNFTRHNRIAMGHVQIVQYIIGITV